MNALPLSTARPASSVREVVAGTPVTLPVVLTDEAGAPLPLAGRTVTYELRTASGRLHAEGDVSVTSPEQGRGTVALGALSTTQGGVYYLRLYVRQGGKVVASVPAGPLGVEIPVPGAGAPGLTEVRLAAALAPEAIRAARQTANDRTATGADTARVEALVDNAALNRPPYASRALLNTALPSLPSGSVVEVSVDTDGQRRRYTVVGGVLTNGVALPVLSLDSKGSTSPPRYTVPIEAVPFAVKPVALRPEVYATQADLDTPEGTTDVLTDLLALSAMTRDAAVAGSGQKLLLDERVYQTTTELQLVGKAQIEGRAGIGVEESIIQCATPGMRSALFVMAQAPRISGVIVDGARNAKHGIFNGYASFGRFTDVTVKNAKRHGMYMCVFRNGVSGLGSNNDAAALTECNLSYNGTFYRTSGFSAPGLGLIPEQQVTVPGTASMAAGLTTVTTPQGPRDYCIVNGTGTNWTTLGIEAFDWIRIGDYWNQILAVVSDTQMYLAESRASGVAITNQPFAIACGCNYYEDRHGDNNIVKINGGVSKGGAAVNYAFNGLYGPRLFSPQADEAGLFGLTLGQVRYNGGYGPALAETGPVITSVIDGPYFENNGVADLGLFSAQGFLVTSPLWGSGADRRYKIDSASALGRIMTPSEGAELVNGY